MSRFLYLSNFKEISDKSKTVSGVDFNEIKIVDILKSNETEVKKAKKLRYFKKPGPFSYPMDLNVGLESYIPRKKSFPQSELHKIEKYIMENPTILEEENSEEMKVFLQRSVMLNIMLCSKQAFTINVIKYRNCFYMNNHNKWRDTAELYPQKVIPQKTYHFKLQQYCFVDSPGKDPVTDIPVNENVQWWSIFEAVFGKYKMIYSAEIVGVEEDDEVKDLKDMEAINECKFVLTRISKTKNEVRNARTCLQAYLAKVHHVYMATTDSHGIINEPLQRKTVKELFEEANFNLKDSLKFLYTVFNMISDKMRNMDCPHTVLQFSFVPKEQAYKYRIYQGKTQMSFLDEEFVEFLKNRHH